MVGIVSPVREIVERELLADRVVVANLHEAVFYDEKKNCFLKKKNRTSSEQTSSAFLLSQR